MKTRFRLWVAALLSTLLVMPGVAQHAPLTEPETADEGAERVRALFLMRDFERGQREGERLLERFPEAPQLKAWTLLSQARNEEADEAAAEAERMVVAAPESPWSHFALAGALSSADGRGEDALAASEEALALRPRHPDFLWLRAQVLLSQGRDREAIAFVDEHRGEVENPAELLTVKGYALYSLSRGAGQDHDEAAFEEALRTYEEARGHDPENLNAHYLPGFQFMVARRMAEAYPHLKRAAERSSALRVHRYYWRALMGLGDRTPDEKQAEVEADVDALMSGPDPSPEVLLAASQQYGELGLDAEQAALEERILQEHPESAEAEWVLVGRYRAFAAEHRERFEDDPELEASYRALLRDFIDRPHHVEDRLLGDAYRELFYAAKGDSSFSDDELLEVIHGMIAYEGINPHVTYAGGAKALAERGAYPREAERIARLGIEAGREKIEEQRERYDTAGDYEQALGWMASMMRDALGWVYFKEGRLAKAEEELLRAYDLHPESVENLHHLGRLYEKKGDLEEAEEYYIKGAMVAVPGTNPNEEALRALYERRQGSLEGYDDYAGRLGEIDRERRRAEVLATRHEDPEVAEPFELKTLEGGVFPSEELEGKVAVINFWGVWCGWCVKEMPEYQALYEAYEADPDVVVLTINNDANPDEVRAWMEEHGYTFPVLRDGGYVSRAEVFAFPTTWFLDREGRKVFEKTGWSEELLEEFSWRIEALR